MERFEEIYYDFQESGLSCEDAAMMLGCSARHFLRLRERYDEEGMAGLKDRRVGRVSKRRATDAEVARITRLYRERYQGFSVQRRRPRARRTPSRVDVGPVRRLHDVGGGLSLSHREPAPTAPSYWND
jgi:transposase